MNTATEGQSSGTPPSSPPGGYALQPSPFSNEDILFCVDVSAETFSEMKITGPNPNCRPITRLDAIKQSIILFINAKLSINSDHRFAFAVLGKPAFWLRKDFRSEVESAFAVLRDISVDSSSSSVDLTHLFRVAACEAMKSRAHNRIFRVILLYCRSSTPPKYQWPATQRLFTLDVVYLHDKPGPKNCPQEVFDGLVEALEHVSQYEGYILRSSHGLTRVLFRNMCTLLSHPQQRCMQEDNDLPKPLVKKQTAGADLKPYGNIVSSSRK